jgi:formylglycine-generating enzyme required for sulfatase activity
LPVTGGTFYRQYFYLQVLDDAGMILAYDTDAGSMSEADPATVSTFQLDKYEVTVGRFRQFAIAWNGGTGYLPPPGSGKHSHLNGGQGLASGRADAGAAYEPGWLATDDGNIAPTDANLGCDPLDPVYDTWTPSVGGNENLPINCVNWYEAYAFCIWDGGFLPSEAEWEYAAAGGDQQREYPWGSADPGSGNQYAIYSCNNRSGSGGCVAAPVGTATLGVGLWGQLDLAGNAAEWNIDGVRSPLPNPCLDCADVTSTLARAARGGSFAEGLLSLPPSSMLAVSPSSRHVNVGFRCARTP